MPSVAVGGLKKGSCKDPSRTKTQGASRNGTGSGGSRAFCLLLPSAVLGSFCQQPPFSAMVKGLSGAWSILQLASPAFGRKDVCFLPKCWFPQEPASLDTKWLGLNMATPRRAWEAQNPMSGTDSWSDGGLLDCPAWMRTVHAPYCLSCLLRPWGWEWGYSKGSLTELLKAGILSQRWPVVRLIDSVVLESH